MLGPSDGLSLEHAVRLPSSQAPHWPLLVLLHGVGQTEADMAPLAEQADGRFAVVAPRAPVEVRPGAFGWSPAQFTSDGPVEDAREMEVSRRKLVRFIEEAVLRYGADRGCVCAAGFSQGAAMLLSIALTCPILIEASAIMSGRIVPQLIPRTAAPDLLARVRLLVVHGTADRIVPIHHARATRAKLQSLAVRLDYREYDMGHEMGAHAVRDVEAWLSSVLDTREADQIP